MSNEQDTPSSHNAASGDSSWFRKVAGCLSLSFLTNRSTSKRQLEEAEAKVREAERKVGKAEEKARQEAALRERAEEKAGQEAALRERAEEKAMQEAALRERAEEKAMQEAALRERAERAGAGTLWTLATRLKVAQKQLPSTKPVLLERPTILKALVPPTSALSPRSISRNPSFVGRNIFGQQWSSMDERAHLIPYSTECRKHWAPVIRLLFGLDDSNQEIDQNQAMFILSGWAVAPGKTRVPGSDITLQPWNYVPLQNQQYLLDRDQVVGFVVEEPWGWQKQWNGQGYSCLVLASKEADYRKMGAGIDCLEDDMTWEVTSREDLERAKKAFGYLADAVVELSALLCDIPVDDQQSKCVQELRQSINESQSVPVLTLPDVPVGDDHYVFLRVTFAPHKEDSQSAENRCKAPHPALLTCRTVNMSLNHVFQNHRDQLGAISTEHKVAALLPSCLDLTTCSMCEGCQEFLSRTTSTCAEIGIDETIKGVDQGVTLEGSTSVSQGATQPNSIYSSVQ